MGLAKGFPLLTGVGNAINISAILWAGTFNILLDPSYYDRWASRFVYKFSAPLVMSQLANSKISSCAKSYDLEHYCS